MTRLVGVRAVCDGCSAAAATTFCVDHQTVLCANCATAQHSTPPNSNHQRVDLASAVTALPFCEHCDDAPATIYCQSEGNTLCDKCDRLVHSTNPHTNSRTPIESTLRHRAVEFRGRTRRSPSAQLHTPRSSAPVTPASQEFSINIEVLTEPRRLPSNVLPTAAPPPSPKLLARYSNLHATPPRNSPQTRRSAKLLARRKLRATTDLPQVHSKLPQQHPQQEQRQQHEQYEKHEKHQHQQQHQQKHQHQHKHQHQKQEEHQQQKHQHHHHQHHHHQQQKQKHQHHQQQQQQQHRHQHPHPHPQQQQRQQQQQPRRRRQTERQQHHQQQQKEQQHLHPLISFSFPDPSSHVTTSRQPDIFNSDQYCNILFQPGSSSALRATHPSFGDIASLSSSHLADPLLDELATQFRSDHDRQSFTDPPIHNFDHMLAYGVIDLSSSTSLDVRNPSSGSASAQASQDSIPQKAQNQNSLSLAALQAGAARFPSNTLETNVFAAAAAAAAAAGELYLLNSVSSGSGSSRTSPPLNDVADPAGVAEAATAAAESAVAASRPMRTVETATEMFGNETEYSGQGHPARVSRLFSELLIGRGGSSDQAVGGQIFDEEMRKLEIDYEVGHGGRLENKEHRMVQSRQQGTGSRVNYNNDLLGQIGVDDMLKRESSDTIGELDMARDDFGFDAMDLGQFEASGYASPGFSLSEHRTKELDWDEDRQG